MPVQAPTSVRESLLDAAYDAAVTIGWSRARMAEVAAAAGVSRQTLYDQFASKDGLALALSMRETSRFLDGTETAMARHVGDPVSAVEAAVRYTLETAQDNPLVRGVLTETGEDGLLPFLTTRALPVIVAARSRSAEWLRTHCPELDPSLIVLVTDVTTRLTLSHMVVAEPESPARAAASIADVVARLLPASHDGSASEEM